MWSGTGFNCPDPHTVLVNNIISLLTQPSQCMEERGVCGPYHGTLDCLGNGSFISDLFFTVNYSMNGGDVECIHRTIVYERISLQIGGIFLMCVHASDARMKKINLIISF